MEDFEAPIDDATESAVDPFGETEAPPQQEESYTPQQSYTPPPQPPPVQPNYNDDFPWIDSVENIGDYTGHLLGEVQNRIGQMFDEKRLYSRVESAEERAKKVHDGSDGLPAYDDLVDHYAIPLMQQQPALRRLVLSQDDPASASFVVVFCARFPHLVQEVLRRNGRIDKTIFRPINFRPTVQGRNSRRRQPSGRLSAAEINAMSPLDFETQVLDPFKLSPEGE